MLLHTNLHHLTSVFFVIVFFNLVYLNTQLFNLEKTENTVSTDSLKTELKETCDTDCINNIYSAIQHATSSSQITNKEIVINNELVKEQYISFGSGINASEDWTDVAGLQVYIDTSKYPEIKEATFEASVNIPTGNQKAYARLFNITDKHPVWFSEVSLEGGETKLLISQPIKLAEGNKLYGVQMKTSLKYTTNLLQSRVHIVLR